MDTEHDQRYLGFLIVGETCTTSTKFEFDLSHAIKFYKGVPVISQTLQVPLSTV